MTKPKTFTLNIEGGPFDGSNALDLNIDTGIRMAADDHVGMIQSLIAHANVGAELKVTSEYGHEKVKEGSSPPSAHRYLLVSRDETSARLKYLEPVYPKKDSQ